MQQTTGTHPEPDESNLLPHIPFRKNLR